MKRFFIISASLLLVILAIHSIFLVTQTPLPLLPLFSKDKPEGHFNPMDIYSFAHPQKEAPPLFLIGDQLLRPLSFYQENLPALVTEDLLHSSRPSSVTTASQYFLRTSDLPALAKLLVPRPLNGKAALAVVQIGSADFIPTIASPFLPAENITQESVQLLYLHQLPSYLKWRFLNPIPFLQTGRGSDSLKPVWEEILKTFQAKTLDFQIKKRAVLAKLKNNSAFYNQIAADWETASDIDENLHFPDFATLTSLAVAEAVDAKNPQAAFELFQKIEKEFPDFYRSWPIQALITFLEVSLSPEEQGALRKALPQLPPSSISKEGFIQLEYHLLQAAKAFREQNLSLVLMTYPISTPPNLNEELRHIAKKYQWPLIDIELKDKEKMNYLYFRYYPSKEAQKELSKKITSSLLELGT